jgi:MFS transporter, FSR family, fosmidomycin resistance protein
MRRFLTPRLALISLAHFVIDSCSSFIAPLYPLLIEKLGLNLTLVGSVVAFSSLSSSLAQPLFGLWADRLRRPWFVAFGPLVAAVFLCSIGLAHSYWTLVALLFLGGIGVAAFHPQAAVAASTLLPRRGLAMSIFVGGGTVGFSVGPLIAVLFASVLGLERTWIWGISGILITFPLVAWFSRMPPIERHAMPRAPLRELAPVARPIATLYFTTICRYATSYGFMTFLPIYLSRKGHAFEFGGFAVSAYLTAGAFGSFFGGWLSDRIGRRNVVLWSLGGALPFYFAFLFLPDMLGLASVVLGGFMLQMSLPVMVVMGQELAPRHVSTVSSLIMGAAWGVSMLMMTPIGALADATSVSVAMAALASSLIVGLALAFTLPETRHLAHTETRPVPDSVAVDGAAPAPHAP